MREIKFRCWDKEKKVFVKGMLCFGYDDFKWVLLNDNYEQILWSYNGELSQYTGLLDKQGVEIYEGDIAKVHSYSVTGLGKVGFNKGSFVFNKFEYPTSQVLHSFSEIEIVGNVFENSELLEMR